MTVDDATRQVERCGIAVKFLPDCEIQRRFGNSTGTVVYETWEIYIASDEPPERQLLAIFHEYGHLRTQDIAMSLTNPDNTVAHEFLAVYSGAEALLLNAERAALERQKKLVDFMALGAEKEHYRICYQLFSKTRLWQNALRFLASSPTVPAH